MDLDIVSKRGNNNVGLISVVVENMASNFFCTLPIKEWGLCPFLLIPGRL